MVNLSKKGTEFSADNAALENIKRIFSESAQFLRSCCFADYKIVYIRQAMRLEFSTLVSRELPRLEGLLSD